MLFVFCFYQFCVDGDMFRHTERLVRVVIYSLSSPLADLTRTFAMFMSFMLLYALCACVCVLNSLLLKQEIYTKPWSENPEKNTLL